MAEAPNSASAGEPGSPIGDRPLAGLSVLVTRARAQSAALADPLEALGAEVIACPVIEVADPLDTAPLDAAIASLAAYDWLVLTSANGVKRFFAWLRTARRDTPVAEQLAGVQIAVVGSATAERLRAAGFEPNLVPADFRAEGLVEAFGEIGVCERCRVLIPRAAEAREVLPEQLRAMGATVDAVDLYRLVAAEPEPTVLDRLRGDGVDVVTFASGATAKHFVALLEGAGVDARHLLNRAAIASVGPITTDGLRSLGLRVDIEAAQSTMESLVEAIAQWAIEHGADRSAR